MANDEPLAAVCSDLRLITIRLSSFTGSSRRRSCGAEKPAQGLFWHGVGSLWSLSLVFNERHLCQFHVDQQTESPLDLKEQCRFLPR